MAKRRKPYTVTKANPAKKKAKKKVAKKRGKKRGAKKAAKRKPAKKKAAKKRTRTNVAKKRTKKKGPSRRRRRRNPARRRNPSARRARITSREAIINYKAPIEGIIPRLAGKAWVAFAVRKWGEPETSPNSATTGAAWTFKNYAIAMLASYVGGEVVGRFANPKAGREFYTGGFDLTVTKFVWSELFHREPKLAIALGNTDPMAMLAAQANAGDVIDDGKGNRWVLQNGQWVAMLGTDGAMGGDDPYEPVPLSAADGEDVEVDYLGALVNETPMDGALVEAGPLSLGHQMEPTASPRLRYRAQYQDTGSPDPYHAVYQQ